MRLIAIALAVLVGAIVIVLMRDKGATRQSVASIMNESQVEPGHAGLKSPAYEVATRAVVADHGGGNETSPVEPAESTEPEPKDASGGVAGSLLDSSGRPIPNAELAFSRGISSFSESGEGRRVRSDAHGYFLIAGLSPGDWHVSFTGTRGHETVGRGMSLGQVLVVAGSVTPADFALEGDRSVSGAFAVADDSGIMLRIDLFLDSKPKVHVAETWLFDEAATVERPGSSEMLEDPEDPEGIRRSRHVPGAFRFEGLIPGAYVLRVVIGAAAEGGEELYLERPVNLLEHDVELPAEDLTWEEFLREAISRKQRASSQSPGTENQD